MMYRASTHDMQQAIESPMGQCWACNKTLTHDNLPLSSNESNVMGPTDTEHTTVLYTCTCVISACRPSLVISLHVDLLTATLQCGHQPHAHLRFVTHLSLLARTVVAMAGIHRHLGHQTNTTQLARRVGHPAWATWHAASKHQYRADKPCNTSW